MMYLPLSGADSLSAWASEVRESGGCRAVLDWRVESTK